MYQKTIPKEFQPSEKADVIIRSATQAILAIVRMGDDVLIQHKKSLISRMLWKITEAHGKWNTRYCSCAALMGGELEHDHVETRKRLVNRIINATEPLESILPDAIGCIVTSEEHKELSKVDEDITGWDRYVKARVRVFDRLEGKKFGNHT